MPECPAIHPGEILRHEFLKPLGWGVVELAERVGLSRALVWALVDGEAGINGEVAARLAACFDNSAAFWLNLQRNYEGAVAEKAAENAEVVQIRVSEGWKPARGLVGSAKKSGAATHRRIETTPTGTKTMAKKSGTTSKKAASSASSTMRSKSTGKKSKSAAGSALSQTGTPKRTTGKKAATAASKTLSDGRTAKKSKAAAGSALSQTPKKKATKSKVPKKN